MKSVLRNLQAILKPLNALLDWVVILLVSVLVADVLWGVFTRFVLQSPSRWSEEVARMVLIWVVLLGAAVAFRRQEHLGFDYIVKQLDSGAQQILAVAAQIIVLLFAALVMIYGGYILVSETLAANQMTPALEIHMGYVYLALPICGFFTVLFSCEQLLKILLKIPAVESDDEKDPLENNF